MALIGLAALSAIRAGEPLRVEADPLPLDSQWKGKLTQGGKTPPGQFFPPELIAELTVTHRYGNEFEAELHETAENLDIVYLVYGSIVQGTDKSVTLRFRSHGVKGVPTAGSYYLNVPYTARFTGDSLKGTWTYDDKEADLALEGTFQLKRVDD
jgi:hypothetical protein